LFEEGKYGKNKDRTKRRNKSMKEIKICFTNPDDVKEFVRAARKCEFDIDLTYQRAVVDAKSILGVFALGLERPLVVNCHGTNQEFEESISKFTM
jgi:phosphocarrier protein HPr